MNICPTKDFNMKNLQTTQFPDNETKSLFRECKPITLDDKNETIYTRISGVLALRKTKYGKTLNT